MASQKSSFPIFPVERVSNAELKEFNEFFFKVLEKHAPRKQKYIRVNNSNYITTALWKEIMHRSQLRNKFLRERKRRERERERERKRKRERERERKRERERVQQVSM